MSDDTQIAKMGQSLPQINQPQQPIQANLNQYGNESTQIAYVQHYQPGYSPYMDQRRKTPGLPGWQTI